jgi:SAM-dependent methyltransferase
MSDVTTREAPSGLRLNLGCGRSPLAGWVNVDSVALPGVDLVVDLDDVRARALPFPDASVDSFALSHVLEHIRNTLPLMEELHRVARPGATAVVRLPHGASDDAAEDPTHVRAYFPGSFGYFSQPYYWRADYGYRGDWQAQRVTLLVSVTDLDRDGIDGLWARIQRERNLVQEMVVELVAIKPIRAPLRELMPAVPVVLQAG